MGLFRSHHTLSYLFGFTLLLGASACQAKTAEDIYEQNCASCHGSDFGGGMASALNDGKWQYGGSNEEVAASIRDGISQAGMPGWGNMLSEEQIRSLVILLREQTKKAQMSAKSDELKPENGVFKSSLHNFKLTPVVTLPGTIWSVSEMPEGDLIATVKEGELYLVSNGQAQKIEGIPQVWAHGQGGLLEVMPHPNYKENGWIYLSFAETHGNGKGITAVVRGKIKNSKWTDQQDIFRVPAEYHTGSGVHFGSRFVFKDGYLFFSIGDRGAKELAQDLSKPNGKIHRIHDDGRVPDDNPFADNPDAYPTVWSYGHRNPQGMDMHPETGVIWESEHGPRGGDEINTIKRGLNYGWPVITYGMNYNGTPMTAQTHKEGMVQPHHYWTPSIAVAGIDFYQGEQFSKWHNQLLVTGMAAEELHRLKLDGSKVVEDEIVLKGQNRLRDVLCTSDGRVFVALNPGGGRDGSIVELVAQ